MGSRTLGHNLSIYERTQSPNLLDRSVTEGARTERVVEDRHITQGAIFFLPAEKDLPRNAVRRAHGKGRIEDKIHDHPVVVISRPASETNIVHFHLITSLKGKPLSQVYDEAVPAQASRRTWYLPIAPTPDHPDATSKKTKKRFPTLMLANGATLKRNSWVNIRHVYRIDASLLQPYNNPETPETDIYSFERQSMIRMLAKCNTLVDYESGSQYACPGLERSASEPILAVENGSPGERHLVQDMALLAFEPRTHHLNQRQEDFRSPDQLDDRIPGPPPKVPPDGRRSSNVMQFVHNTFDRPYSQVLGGVQSAVVFVSQKPQPVSVDILTRREPFDQFWRNLKGVTAVAIASI